jgi:hypothetical protein
MTQRIGEGYERRELMRYLPIIPDFFGKGSVRNVASRAKEGDSAKNDEHISEQQVSDF